VVEGGNFFNLGKESIVDLLDVRAGERTRLGQNGSKL
jgi:hypothetical protein